MKFVGLIGKKETHIEILKENGQYHLTLNGKSFTVDAFRPGHQILSLLVDGKSFEVELEKAGNVYSVHFYRDTINLEIYEARKFQAGGLVRKTVSDGPLKVVAPMPGKIIRVVVGENAHVNEGDPLLIMEAMKMQNELKAPKSGIVKNIHAKEGEPVSAQQVLIVLE